MNDIATFERELFHVTNLVRSELTVTSPANHLAVIRRWAQIIDPSLRQGFYLQMFEPSARYSDSLEAAAGAWDSPTTEQNPPALTVTATVQNAPPFFRNRPTMIQIPVPIRQAHQRRKLVPFVGAGLSLATGVVGGFPLWHDLPIRLLQACREFSRIDDAEAALYEQLLRRPASLEERLAELDKLKVKLDRDYHQAVSKIFRPHNIQCGEAHKSLVRLNCPILATTNYDQLIEDAEGPPRRNVYTWRDMPAAMGEIDGDRKILLKVHGCAAKPDSIVMTASEYRDVQAEVSYAGILEHLIKSTSLLFIGYGMNDPFDLDIILKRHTSVFKGSSSRHFALMLGTDQTSKDRLRRDYNVQVVDVANYDEIVPFIDGINVV